MSVGTVFLEALLTGVITPAELQWVTNHQGEFSRVEEAVNKSARTAPMVPWLSLIGATGFGTKSS